MSRRAAAPSRTILPDPKFKSDMLAKFMNVVMESGKKSAAERIIYGALDRITEKTGRGGSEALEGLSTALENVRSEEHTSELQSHSDLVCRLLLEKKKPSRRPSARRNSPGGRRRGVRRQPRRPRGRPPGSVRLGRPNACEGWPDASRAAAPCAPAY